MRLRVPGAVNRRCRLGSDTFERGGQPRSVLDSDAEAYEVMVRLHRETLARRAVEAQPKGLGAIAEPIPHVPDGPVDAIAAGLAHIFNGPREARKEVEQGYVIRGLVDGATAAADLEVGGSAANGVRKGYFKLGGSHAWRDARKWLGKIGFAEKFQHVHHALVPNRGWGKAVPDFIKNQPWNLKAMESSLDHVRIHSNSRQFGLPQFNSLGQYWHGTPTWWKAANASAAGHSVQAVVDGLFGRYEATPPDPQPQTK